MIDRTGHNELLSLINEVTERAEFILRHIQQCKYMTTGQIRRVYYTETSSILSSIRSANRDLARLRAWALIQPLERRIGGVRAGSGAYVWALTQTGTRLLALKDGTPQKGRHRVYEPSLVFLTHTLAITELDVRLRELTKTTSAELSLIQHEPICWRNYVGLSGAANCLRPDLFAITTNEEYIDYWFFEVDLATESPACVLRKCEQYLAYYRSGQEQKKCDIFPRVIWIVPNSKRQDVLRKHIQDNLPPRAVKLFSIILMEELMSLITGEIYEEKP